MQLYDRYHCKSAASITAYNPASQELSIAENVARNKKSRTINSIAQLSILVGDVQIVIDF
jgi:hypothetical protein